MVTLQRRLAKLESYSRKRFLECRDSQQQRSRRVMGSDGVIQTLLMTPVVAVESTGEYLAPLFNPGEGTVTGGPSGQGASAANIAGYQSTAQKTATIQQESSDLQQAGLSADQ